MSFLTNSALTLGTLLIASQSFAYVAPCNLEGDRCKGRPLSSLEIAKTVYLRDQVAEKLLQIESEEKARGRDFKVAFISRQGTGLSRFQRLIETDDSGKIQTTQEMINDIIVDSNIEIRDPTAPNSMGTVRAGLGRAIDQRRDRDESRALKYSHMGIAIKNAKVMDKNGKLLTNPENGEWAIYQLLYSCDDKHMSYVYSSGLTHFFADHMSDYGAQIIVPEQALQDRVEDIVLNQKMSNEFLQHHYNAAALPNSLEEQNSNQWILELIAGALAPAGQVNNREQAQAYLSQTGYFGTRLTTRGLATMLNFGFGQRVLSHFMPTVCLAQQPSLKKYGLAEIITVNSLHEYLGRMKQVTRLEEVKVRLSKEEREELEQADKEQQAEQQQQIDDSAQ